MKRRYIAMFMSAVMACSQFSGAAVTAMAEDVIVQEPVIEQISQKIVDTVPNPQTYFGEADEIVEEDGCCKFVFRWKDVDNPEELAQTMVDSFSAILQDDYDLQLVNKAIDDLGVDYFLSADSSLQDVSHYNTKNKKLVGCHAYVYAIWVYNNLVLNVVYSPDLTVEDYDSSKSSQVEVPQTNTKTETETVTEQKVTSDLIRLSDGSYKTSDGRFQVNVGEAMVYRDGEAYTTDATLLRKKDVNREELQIYNFYRNDSILFTRPYNSVLTGDSFDREDIELGDDSNFYDEYATKIEWYLEWTWSNGILAVCHDGDYLLCHTGNQNDFKDAAARVLYWDTDQQEAVFYIYASFKTAPYEYEAVAAVKMEDTQSASAGGSSDGNNLFEPCDACDGSGVCNTCGGTGSVTKWVGDQYMTVTCTEYYCNNGRCSVCWGTGHK